MKTPPEPTPQTTAAIVAGLFENGRSMEAIAFAKGLERALKEARTELSAANQKIAKLVYRK